VAALQQEVEALGFSAAETAAALEARKQEVAAIVGRLGDVTQAADLREAELLQVNTDKNEGVHWCTHQISR